MKQYKNHFLVILAIYFLIFLTMSLSPYVIVSGEENSLSHILFFASVVLHAKCKNVANKMQKIGFKKRHFKRLLNAK